jgi:hypothetical protein
VKNKKSVEVWIYPKENAPKGTNLLIWNYYDIFYE